MNTIQALYDHSSIDIKLKIKRAFPQLNFLIRRINRTIEQYPSIHWNKKLILNRKGLLKVRISDKVYSIRTIRDVTTVEYGSKIFFIQRRGV